MTRETQAHLENEARKENMAVRDHLDHRGPSACKDHQDLLVHPESQVPEEYKEYRAEKDQKVLED